MERSDWDLPYYVFSKVIGKKRGTWEDDSEDWSCNTIWMDGCGGKEVAGGELALEFPVPNIYMPTVDL